MSTPKCVIDDSPRKDEGEIGHLGRDAAVEYLPMSERVKKIEGQVEVIGSNLETIKIDLHKIADALGKLCDLKCLGQGFAGPIDGDYSYVS